MKQHRINDTKLFEFAVGKFMKESSSFKTQYQALYTEFRYKTQEVMSACSWNKAWRGAKGMANLWKSNEIKREICDTCG